MKAVVYSEYGSPDVLKLQEVEKPSPGENEVLIKLHVTSLNASDWEALTGRPLYVRIFGLFKPKMNILGSDIAGTVEAVGKNVTQFKPGDEVFGDTMGSTWGGFAEYTCAREDVLVRKPENISFEDAASLPQAATIALQGLRNKGGIQAGQKVLINGAGGSGGSFAIQLAKLFGAEVTAVDNSEKLEMMHSLGADHVIDYRKQDFTRNGQKYDRILDLVAYHPLFDHKRALNENGIYLMVGGAVSMLFKLLLLGPWISMLSRKKMGILGVRPNKEDMKYILELIDTGKIKPAIDKRFPLEKVPEALRYIGEGHAKGKVVITMM